jgi:uncharacterized tellurite resistance protein B-like protein
LLDEENAINAFAAGHTTNDAAIGVTRGCMRLLSRDELQGVIGHEFSHILNGDMRLNLRLIGIIHGILCIAILGRILLRTGSSSSSNSGSRKGGNPLPLIGLALIAIGFIGVFFGRLIKSAVSRQREFLADAASVQFTRNPSGLAGALKKIGGYVYGSRLLTAHAEEASHLYFGNGLGEAWFEMMATHPPLKDRILAIDPSFDGKFPVVLSEEAEVRTEKAAKAGIPIVSQLARDISGAELAGMRAQTVQAAEVVARVGAPTPKHLEYAANFRAVLPAPLLQTVRDSMGAAATVFGLVLSTDSKVQQQQRQKIREHFDAATEARALEINTLIADQDSAIKLPLLTLTLSALRNLSVENFDKFDECVHDMIEADCEIDLFEYAVLQAVIRHLEPQFRPRGREVIQYYSLTPLLSDCAVLLSALAHSSSTDHDEVVRAFAAAVPQLRHGVTSLSLLQAVDCGLGPVDEALKRLALAVPQIKKNVLDACAHTVAADGLIQPHEAELLRAIADALDCPIPPFLKGV